MSIQGLDYEALCSSQACRLLTLTEPAYPLWVLFLFGVTSFVAGLQVRRSNWVLPTLTLATIATTVWLQYEAKIRIIRYGMFLTAKDRIAPPPPISADALSHYQNHHGATFFFTAVVPFALGAAINAIRNYRKRANVAH